MAQAPQNARASTIVLGVTPDPDLAAHMLLRKTLACVLGLIRGWAESDPRMSRESAQQ